MKTVKAKVVTAVIYAVLVEMVNGEIIKNDLAPVTTTDTVTENNAVKIFRKNSPELAKNATICIDLVERKTEVYEMPLAAFIANENTRIIK